ncbi:MAG: excinuclease ABC subunit UvrC [Acholeplasmatales bacterium]|nr:excinuclease ABC subunit UvrC [Acholeplasmatales bacterium]
MNSLIEEKLKLLPDKPGSYQMRDKDGEIIYVGKAKNLKNRVRSYFHGVHNAKTTLLVSNICDFSYVICESELEALVLEINLIKEYNPKFNISLTDDKTYPYIALTNETHPRLLVTRDKRKKGFARYFGPYPNVGAARSTVDLLNRIYPLRKCRIIPNKLCLYYHLGQCLGPCVYKDLNIDYTEYKNNIAKFLNGNSFDVLELLNKKMIEASDKLDFERAIELRDMISNVKDATRRQKISINDLTSRDYVGIYENDGDLSINIIITRLGSIVQNHQTIINSYSDIESDLLSYLIQFYDLNTKPSELCIGGVSIDNIDELLGIKTVDFKLGKKKELLDMALYNAKFNLENKRNVYKNTILKKKETIEELGELLGIKTPRRIEAFDNSNLFGEYPVSGLVVYVDGKQSPKDFRKYHIKTVVGANDYATMKEVIYRRYYRLLMDGDKLPDLLIMDGGEIQVHAAEEIINSLELDIPVMGIQKDDHHKATIIFFKDKFINIDKNSNIYLLLADISQKVHDFAISFFRSTKAKGFFKSQLDEIEGLGPKRKEELIRYFTTIDNVKLASKEELKKAGMPKNLCENIYNYFHNNDENSQN